MASANSFALDVVMAAFMGARPQALPILEAAMARGLAPATVDGVDILGDSLDKVRSGDWRLPATRVGLMERISGRLPPAISRRMGSLLVRRPVPDRKLCNSCGDCVRNCPQKCIRIVNDVLKIDYARCQSCFCCSETCPNRAMKVREPLFSF